MSPKKDISSNYLNNFEDRKLLSPIGYTFEKTKEGAILVEDSKRGSSSISCDGCPEGEYKKKGGFGKHSCSGSCDTCDMIIYEMHGGK